MTPDQRRAIERAYNTIGRIDTDNLTPQERADVNAAIRHLAYVLWPSISREDQP